MHRYLIQGFYVALIGQTADQQPVAGNFAPERDFPQLRCSRQPVENAVVGDLHVVGENPLPRPDCAHPNRASYVNRAPVSDVLWPPTHQTGVWRRSQPGQALSNIVSV